MVVGGKPVAAVGQILMAADTWVIRNGDVASVADIYGNAGVGAQRSESHGR